MISSSLSTKQQTPVQVDDGSNNAKDELFTLIEGYIRWHEGAGSSGHGPDYSLRSTKRDDNYSTTKFPPVVIDTILQTLTFSPLPTHIIQRGQYPLSLYPSCYPIGVRRLSRAVHSHPNYYIKVIYRGFSRPQTRICSKHQKKLSTMRSTLDIDLSITESPDNHHVQSPISIPTND